MANKVNKNQKRSSSSRNSVASKRQAEKNSFKVGCFNAEEFPELTKDGATKKEGLIPMSRASYGLKAKARLKPKIYHHETLGSAFRITQDEFPALNAEKQAKEIINKSNDIKHHNRPSFSTKVKAAENLASSFRNLKINDKPKRRRGGRRQGQKSKQKANDLSLLSNRSNTGLKTSKRATYNEGSHSDLIDLTSPDARFNYSDENEERLNYRKCRQRGKKITNKAVGQEALSNYMWVNKPNNSDCEQSWSSDTVPSCSSPELESMEQMRSEYASHFPRLNAPETPVENEIEHVESDVETRSSSSSSSSNTTNSTTSKTDDKSEEKIEDPETRADRENAKKREETRCNSPMEYYYKEIFHKKRDYTSLRIEKGSGNVLDIPPNLIQNGYGIACVLHFLGGFDAYPERLQHRLGLNLADLGIPTKIAPDTSLTFGTIDLENTGEDYTDDFYHYVGNFSGDASSPMTRDSIAAPDYLYACEKLTKTKHAMAHYPSTILFTMFFAFPQDVIQLFAASELYRRNWFWYTGVLPYIWISKDNSYEYQVDEVSVSGLYVVFDVNSWSTKIASLRIFNYYVDERPRIDESCFAMLSDHHKKMLGCDSKDFLSQHEIGNCRVEENWITIPNIADNDKEIETSSNCDSSNKITPPRKVVDSGKKFTFTEETPSYENFNIPQTYRIKHRHYGQGDPSDTVKPSSPSMGKKRVLRPISKGDYSVQTRKLPAVEQPRPLWSKK